MTYYKNIQKQTVLVHPHDGGGAGPGTGRLVPGGVQLAVPSPQGLRLLEPSVVGRWGGVGDSREAEEVVSLCAGHSVGVCYLGTGVYVLHPRAGPH